MFKLLKIFFYAVLAAVVVFLYWFLPKYSYVQKNPGYCINLTQHLYYCGDKTDLGGLFGSGK